MLFVLVILSIASISAILLKWREVKRVHRTTTLPGRVEHFRSLAELEQKGHIHAGSPLVFLVDRAQGLREELLVYHRSTGVPQAGIRPAEMQALEISLGRETDAVAQVLERRLPLLQITAAVSPLLGLLGTVVGVLLTFRGIAEVGNASLTAVAPGVAEALITTVAGLCVAIPAVVAHAWFSARIEEIRRRMEQFGADLVTILSREMRSGGAR